MAPAQYAGSLHRSYHLFFVDLGVANKVSELEESLLSFAKTIRKLQNAFFLLIPRDALLDIFARTPFADGLIQISSNTGPAPFNHNGMRSLEFPLDFEGAAMTATVVITAESAVERFRPSGVLGSGPMPPGNHLRIGRLCECAG